MTSNKKQIDNTTLETETLVVIEDLDPETVQAMRLCSATARMVDYEADQQKLHDLQTGPDGEAFARIVAAQAAIGLDELELKKAVKLLGDDIQGVNYEALLQVRHQASDIAWNIETIKAQSWGPAVILETVDKTTFDALVKAGRVKTPDIFRTVTEGKEISAVTIKPKEIMP
jgi:hypothetical protein